MNGLTISSSSHEFNRLVLDARRTYNSAQNEWVHMLRSKGIRAAHPDDGWVDRKENSIMFAYPEFDDVVWVGSHMALGDHRSYRIVVVTRLEQPRFFSVLGLKYFFEDVWRITYRRSSTP